MAKPVVPHLSRYLLSGHRRADQQRGTGPRSGDGTRRRHGKESQRRRAHLQMSPTGW